MTFRQYTVKYTKAKDMLTFDKFNSGQELTEGVNDPAIFKAVFLAGGPGSGKSFVVGKTALQSLGFKLINSDNAFEKGLEKAGLSTNPEDIASAQGQKIRAGAKALTGRIMERALEGRLGLVIDGTGKDYNKIKSQVDNLRKIGYDVTMIFVNTDLDTALQRNKNRDRSLPNDMVGTMWKGVQANLGKFQGLFRNKMIIVDNSVGSDIERSTLIAYKKIMTWSKQKPESSIAMKWISSQKPQKIKEEVLDDTDSEVYNEGKSGADRLTSRLKKKGVDLDKRAKDRKAEYERLKKQYAAEDSDPCWDTHKQVGTKMKNGKSVPNCVPK